MCVIYFRSHKSDLKTPGKCIWCHRQ